MKAMVAGLSLYIYIAKPVYLLVPFPLPLLTTQVTEATPPAVSPQALPLPSPPISPLMLLVSRPLRVALGLTNANPAPAGLVGLPREPPQPPLVAYPAVRGAARPLANSKADSPARQAP